MPASRSTARAPKPAASFNLRWPLILLGLAIVLGCVVFALPASLIARFLPKNIVAGDFSGSVWHGSAGQVSFNGRNAGALEWQLHPAALLSLTVNAEVHWVKNASVYDARIEATRRGVLAHEVHGGGPLSDFADFGMAPGWRGNLKVQLAEVASDFSKLTALSGSIQASELTAPSVLGGSDLGGYEVSFPTDALSEGNLRATLHDTGGPVETSAEITLNTANGTGLLSGTLKERAGASAALHEQLENLAQLKPRDPSGRIPVELEFSL